MTRLDAIKKREQAATKGPWKARRNVQRPYKHVEFDRNGYTTSPIEAADAIFLAHARTDLPWAVAQVETLAGAAKALHDAYIARISHRHTHPTDSYDFLPKHCVRCRAEREITVALTRVQTALAALEAPNA